MSNAPTPLPSLVPQLPAEVWFIAIAVVFAIFMGVFIVIGAMLIKAVKVWMGAATPVRVDAQPVEVAHPKTLNVQQVPELVTREEFREMEAELKRISTLGEERGRRLHARIDPLVENTAFIKGSMEAFTESFRNFANMHKAKE